MENSKKTNILIVDDLPDNLVVLEAVLSRSDYNLVPAKSGPEALDLLLKHNFAVILLDVRMPGMDGFETATVIKRQNQNQYIPIIFISASFMDPDSIQHGYEVGGVEYLVKPFDPKALQTKVAFFVDLYKKNLKSEEQLLIERSLREQERQGTLNQLESEKRKLEKALGDLQDEKDLREKFVATLSHDLRNPITAAKMSAQLIERNTETVEANRKHLRRLINNIDRADHMIQDLLDANRIRAGEKLPLTIAEWNMREIIQTTISELITVHGDRIKLIGPDEIKGFWCRTGVRRIIENLVNNGLKYGDPHKSVTVTLKDDLTKVKILVHNEGKPLTPEEQVNIFDLYKRLHSVHSTSSPGWGLGLTLVRGVAEGHNGQVEVQSTQEEGTTFIVTLPKDCRLHST